MEEHWLIRSPYDQQVNSLNSEVMSEIQSILRRIQSDSSIKSAVIISGKPGCFIAGADINMLAACKTADQVKQISKSGQQILGEIESSPKPIVAAISGSCLGGGLEVYIIINFQPTKKSKNFKGILWSYKK